MASDNPFADLGKDDDDEAPKAEGKPKAEDDFATDKKDDKPKATPKAGGDNTFKEVIDLLAKHNIQLPGDTDEKNFCDRLRTVLHGLSGVLEPVGTGAGKPAGAPLKEESPMAMSLEDLQKTNAALKEQLSQERLRGLLGEINFLAEVEGITPAECREFTEMISKPAVRLSLADETPHVDVESVRRLVNFAKRRLPADKLVKARETTKLSLTEAAPPKWEDGEMTPERAKELADELHGKK